MAVTKRYCAVTGEELIKLWRAASKSSSLQRMSTSSRTTLQENAIDIQNKRLQIFFYTDHTSEKLKRWFGCWEEISYLLRFVISRNPSLMRYIKRPGVAIRTSTPSSRFSNWVFCLKPPVTTMERNGTPDFDIDRQLFKTCRIIFF